MSSRPVMPTHETMTWLVKQGRKIEQLGSVSGTAGVPLYRAQGRARFTGYCDYGIGMPTQLNLAANTGWIELDVQTGVFAWVAVPVFPTPPGKRYFRSANISGDLYV